VSTATVRRYLGLESGSLSTTATLGPALTPTTLRYQARNAMRPETPAQETLRRAINMAVALIGILLTAPLMVLIAVAIKVSSRGPVFYSQPRVGVDRRASRGPGALNHRRKQDQGGRIFTIYKFRTMRSQTGPAQQVWAGKNDPRVTRVGRVLRAFRLDELPQLFNVLKGDMNIVGPRPEQPAIFQDLQSQLGRYRDRQRVLPGITGLAQVSLGYDSCVDDVQKKVALDLEYIRRRSPAEDLVIMAKTMPVMIMRKGAV
jgi:lipopolysaccharide/colanic/teichoic acid biosynthesis glycosyltransferase